jgi:hypothetical protein
MSRPVRHRSEASARAGERGAVLIFGLIALLVMLAGTAALMRATNASLFVLGNYGFKRDLANQSERAVSTVLTALQSGGLSTALSRQASVTTLNYSATILPVNAQGIPLALVDDSGFAAVGAGTNDIALADQGVTLRYVVDRLCANAGPVDPAACMLASPAAPPGGGSSELLSAMDSSGTSSAGGGAGGSGAVPLQAVYRVSIRVTGPRGTQSFFQTTVAL